MDRSDAASEATRSDGQTARRTGPGVGVGAGQPGRLRALPCCSAKGACLDRSEGGGVSWMCSAQLSGPCACGLTED